MPMKSRSVTIPISRLFFVTTGRQLMRFLRMRERASRVFVAGLAVITCLRMILETGVEVLESPVQLSPIKRSGERWLRSPTRRGAVSATVGGKMELVDVAYFAARCVNPPDGVKSQEWIAQGFPGAECK